MHSDLIVMLAYGTGAIALGSMVPTPLAPLLVPAKQAVRRYLNGPALGFLVATVVLGTIGLLFQSWLSEALGHEVPFGTVRWVLMTPELGLWGPILSGSTAIMSGALAWFRGRAFALGIPPAAALSGVTFALWYAW